MRVSRGLDGHMTRLLAALQKLPRAIKIFIAIGYDFIACVAVGLGVSLFRGVAGVSLSHAIAASLTGAAVAVACIAMLGGYAAVVRFMSGSSTFNFAISLLVGSFVWLLLLQHAGAVKSPAGILYWAGTFGLVFGSRFALRRANLRVGCSLASRIPVAIYGAGATGRQLAASLNQEAHYRPVAFIDDDVTLHGLWVSGLKVHSRDQLPRLIRDNGVNEVLLALPNATAIRRREILRVLSELSVKIQTIPSITELLSGKAKLGELRPVMIEDVLGREPVVPDGELLRCNVEGKVVLVTGAGGSIGSELCRSIATLGPRALVLLDISEHSLFRIENELRDLVQDGREPLTLHVVMGSVENATLARQVFLTYGVETVFHAAAYKHVPLVEMNVVEGVRNNVVGTKMLLDAIAGSSVSTFVMISTDKAVRPTSVMGASKRVAELLVQTAAARDERCKMSIVRFGNVLGSSGSVLPLFRAQIASGGPITVTHPEVTRFFMTIPEAAQLVIQAGALGRHGEVFHLDMGEPIRILDLARRLLRLHGLRERSEGRDGDIDIRIVGLRPGEKLYEELLIDSRAQATPHPRIFRARERCLPAEELSPLLMRLITACHVRDEAAVMALLRRLVEGYEGFTQVPPGIVIAPDLPDAEAFAAPPRRAAQHAKTLN